MDSRLLKSGLSLRGDHYYCPLALQLSTYWNCEPRCAHCYLRRLNRTWGEDLRPLSILDFERQILRGIDNANPRTPLGHAIRQRKTVYIGAKSDPYQPAERVHRATRNALRILLSHGFSVVIATMFTENVWYDMELIERYASQVTLMPIVSPGMDRDWEILERQQTTRPGKRLADAANWAGRGLTVGINGEPFIPGFHTVGEFARVIRLIRNYGLKSYNTYNLHLNDWNAKAMYQVGVDIERVWEMNQDRPWRDILQELISIAGAAGVVLGCPDFVNSGEYAEPVNTCCGFDVPNPCTFNLITWKKLRARGMSDEQIIDCTWDGVGDKEEGRRLLAGGVKELYTLDDIKRDDGKLI